MNIDFILSLIKLTFVAAALGVGLSFVIWYLFRSLYAGLVLVLLLFLMTTGAVRLPVFSVGISAYPQDIVFSLIAIAAFLRAASLPTYPKLMWTWLFVGAVLMVSFIPGVLQFGTSAGVEFREYYYFWTGTFYFMTFAISARQLTYVVHLWSAAASVVVLIAIYRWFVHFTDGDTSVWAEMAATNPLRVVNSAQTLFIAQALILVLYLRLRSAATSWMAVLPFFAIAVLVLQHRTVWVVTLVCMFAVMYMERKARGRLVGNLITVAVVGAAIVVPALLASSYLDVVTESLQASVTEAQGERSTFVWRILSWQELLKGWAALGPWQYLFGSPFGTGVARYIPGVAQEITVGAHSYYVQTLLRIGLVGLIATILVYLRALFALYRSRDIDAQFPRRGLLVLLLGQLVYFVTYAPTYTDSILLGTALALVGRNELMMKREQRSLIVSPI